MEVTYERGLNETWVLLPEEEPAEEYACRLLEQNRCGHLLRLERRSESGRTRYAFAVSRGNSLSRIYQMSPMTYQELRQVLTGLAQAVEEAESCLLDLGHFVLKPELIYASPDMDHLQFCCHPGYNRDFFLQVRDLMRYFVQKMDHRNPEDTEIVYRLLDICEQEYYSFEDLMQEIGRASSGRLRSGEADNPPDPYGRKSAGTELPDGRGMPRETEARILRRPRRGKNPGEALAETGGRETAEGGIREIPEEENSRPKRAKGGILTVILLAAAAVFAGVFLWFGLREAAWDWRYGAAALCMTAGALVCGLSRRKARDAEEDSWQQEDDDVEKAGVRDGVFQGGGTGYAADNRNGYGNPYSPGSAGRTEYRSENGDRMEYSTDNQSGYDSYSPGSAGRTEYRSGNGDRMEYSTDNQNGYGNLYSSGSEGRTEYNPGNTGRTEYSPGNIGHTEYSPVNGARTEYRGGTHEECSQRSTGRTGYSQENENRTEYGTGTRNMTGYLGRDESRAPAGGRIEYRAGSRSRTGDPAAPAVSTGYREVHSPKTGRSEPLPQPDPDTELSPETTFLGETTFLPGLQAEASAGPRLVPLKKGKGKETAVKPLPFLIGTLPGEANLLLPGHSVSRIHARIEEEDGQYMIVDCRSTNGTWVNGIRLRPEERYPLREGDVIRFADIKMRFK